MGLGNATDNGDYRYFIWRRMPLPSMGLTDAGFVSASPNRLLIYCVSLNMTSSCWR